MKTIIFIIIIKLGLLYFTDTKITLGNTFNHTIFDMREIIFE